jgi:hypothetical protein
MAGIERKSYGGSDVLDYRDALVVLAGTIRHPDRAHAPYPGAFRGLVIYVDIHAEAAIAAGVQADAVAVFQAIILHLISGRDRGRIVRGRGDDGGIIRWRRIHDAAIRHK